MSLIQKIEAALLSFEYRYLKILQNRCQNLGLLTLHHHIDIQMKRHQIHLVGLVGLLRH